MAACLPTRHCTPWAKSIICARRLSICRAAAWPQAITERNRHKWDIRSKRRHGWVS